MRQLKQQKILIVKVIISTGIYVVQYLFVNPRFGQIIIHHGSGKHKHIVLQEKMSVGIVKGPCNRVEKRENLAKVRIGFCDLLTQKSSIIVWVSF